VDVSLSAHPTTVTPAAIVANVTAPIFTLCPVTVAPAVQNVVATRV
jgi:hypothetical protein